MASSIVCFSLSSFCMSMSISFHFFFFFFFNDTATTEIYTLSLHDALPICQVARINRPDQRRVACASAYSPEQARFCRDRKSTRLNSSHGYISYAVFCLKKKKELSALPIIQASFTLSFAELDVYHTADIYCT